MGIALEPLFKDDDRLVELSQGYSRLSQKIEREVRMERIEPLAGIDRIDRYRCISELPRRYPSVCFIRR
jgi:hypothetical protein